MLAATTKGKLKSTTQSLGRTLQSLWISEHHKRFQVNHVNSQRLWCSEIQRLWNPKSCSHQRNWTYLMIVASILLPKRFNTSTKVFNENGRFSKFTETINGNNCMCIFPNNEIYVKLEDKRDDIDWRMFCVDKIGDLELMTAQWPWPTRRTRDWKTTQTMMNTKSLAIISPSFWTTRAQSSQTSHTLTATLKKAITLPKTIIHTTWGNST